MKERKLMPNFSIENARIGFKNFSGKEGQYNAAGNRKFAIFLEEDLGRQFESDGWNVRWLNPRDPDDSPAPMLSVKVAFGNYPPKIVLISGSKKSELNEDGVHILDWAEIETVDLVIRPYQYNVNGKSGIKAYLKAMYVTLVADKFAEKYEFGPDSAQDAIGGCGNCGTCKGNCGNHAEHL